MKLLATIVLSITGFCMVYGQADSVDVKSSDGQIARPSIGETELKTGNAPPLEGGEIKTLSNQEIAEEHDAHMGSQAKGTNTSVNNPSICTGGSVIVTRDATIWSNSRWYGNYTGTGDVSPHYESYGNDNFYYSFSPTSSGTYHTYIQIYNGWLRNYSSTSINVVSDPSISISGGGTICAGSSRTLTASVSGGTGTQSYQWQISTNGGGTWSNVGLNSSTYNTGALTSTRWYRCIRTASGSGCNTAFSNMVTVSVQQPPTAPTSISGTSTICQGESTTLTASGGSNGSGAIYQWYSGGCGSGYVGSGSIISVSPMSTTTYYVRRQGTTTCTNTTSCASVTVVVNQISVIPTSVNAVVNP